jgi:hypothetical protein
MDPKDKGAWTPISWHGRAASEVTTPLAFWLGGRMQLNTNKEEDDDNRLHFDDFVELFRRDVWLCTADNILVAAIA